MTRHQDQHQRITYLSGMSDKRQRHVCRRPMPPAPRGKRLIITSSEPCAASAEQRPV